MKKIIYSVYCLFIISLFGCSKSDNNSPAGNENTITISGMSFSPSSKTVVKGTIVKWINNGGTTHTATSNDGTTFNSGNLNAGSGYSYAANTPGTFEYHCLIHGLAMSGTLIVTQ